MEPPSPLAATAAMTTMTTTTVQVPPPTTSPTPTPTPTSTITANVAIPPTIPPHKTSSYPDSRDSSPRSRNNDSWDDPPVHTTPVVSSKLRLMCSYGGHIVPRPHDKSLCYVGGDTRIVVVDRNTNLSSLSSKLSHTLLNDRSFTLKYQLPSEDLDSLISVTTDEDLDNMIDEYDRTTSASNSSNKPSRIRLFLFPLKPESSQSIPILENTTKSDDWFLDALNGAGLLNRGFSDTSSVNCLLGLDDDVASRGGGGGGGSGGNLDLSARDADGLQKSAKHQLQQHQQKGGQDVHSVPDSPMLETTSSFGSTSSSPCLANLPPIRVHVEDRGGAGFRVHDQKVGIEEQFAQMSVGVAQKQQDEGFMAMSTPPPMPNIIAGPGVPVNSGDFPSRVCSDDERSDHGVPVGYRKPPTPTPQSQSQSQPQIPLPQTQQKSNGGYDLPSPDSVSSDNSLNNSLARPKPVIYQEQNAHIPSGANRVTGNPVDPSYNVSDPNTRVHVQEPGYLLQPQFDQPPQKQFINSGTHYISHHHPTGAVQMPAYYHMYSPQQQPIHHHHPQLEHQQYAVYYMPVQQPQPYNIPVQQQSSMTETTNPQTPPSPVIVPPSAAFNPMRNAPIAQPETAPAGVYRTAAPGGPQLVQMATNQQQYVGYSQIHHHPSHSVNPTSSANVNYAYEYVDPAHGQMYYTQGRAPTMPSQYQTMTAGAAPGMGLHEGSTQLSSENIKQQIRTSQPL